MCVYSTFCQPFLSIPGDREIMAMYELLERRIEERKTKPVVLYDLLEVRIREAEPPDTLWRLLALRIKERGEDREEHAG
jgi:hypothetical protein